MFSAFSWAYVIGQILGGWLLDRFGSKRVYFGRSLSGRCLPCCKASSISLVDSALSLPCLHCASVGLAEAPFPRNSRIVAARFPRRKGNGGVDFNSAQYFATVIFAPIMGWLTHEVGWSHVFFFMGGLGIVISFIWLKVIHEPNQHPA